MIAEVAERSTTGSPYLGLVQAGTRSVTLDLPSWMLERHAEIAAAVAGTGQTTTTSLSPSCSDHREWYISGLSTAGGTVTDATEGILRAAGTVRAHPAESEPPHSDLRPMAVQWLREPGAAAFGLEPAAELDLAELIAAVRVLDALGRAEPEMARAAVFLVHQIGRRAIRSLHLEALTRQWLMRPDRHTVPGVWQRLRTLELPAELDDKKLREVLDFCRGILIKPTLRGPESELAPIARALLAATGRLTSADALLRDELTTARLARMGRSLSPSAGMATAQSALLDCQRTELWSIADHVILDGVRLTLLTPEAPLPRDQREFVHGYLRGVGRP